MKPSALLAQTALFGLLACGMTAMRIQVTGNPVPVAAGVFLALLLLVPALLLASASAEMTPGERYRLHHGEHVFAGRGRLVWLLIAFWVPWTLYWVLANTAWTLVPLLLAACTAGVLSFPARRRERRELREALAYPELTGPKITGIRSPEQVPPDWTPVLVHRIDRGRFDMLVDYRIIVDGDRVGALGPGQTLVMGLPPGPHHVQGGLARLTNAPVRFTAEPGAAVCFVIEPARPDRRANADRRARPGAYFQVVRVPSWLRAGPL
ncbi:MULTISPECIES: hypothetical protein [Nocardiopsis]|uniref:hypothetical protein n=1 Tax=Nocardiopsis TaxID=2013 RepID=UPI001F41B372|nr:MULTISPECIES: hypothetical protein [Nocardiopsis]